MDDQAMRNRTNRTERRALARRRSSAVVRHGLALLLMLVATAATATTEKYRLSWFGDPATTMVIGWSQSGGSNPVVHYDTVDHGTNWAAYASSAPPARQVNAMGMDNRFARLTGLQPNTAHYFVVRDSDGVSQRFWFRTAPDDCSSFAFVAGGDSRNNRTPRRDANILVSKLRPLFVAFGGDYTFADTSGQWQDWLDDWQSSISSDGRLYPIVATRGNHDTNGSVNDMFDTPSTEIYYALSFGSLLRLYTLNSEITEGGTQGNWLASDLAANAGLHVFESAQYHKPMRPHTTAKSEGQNEYNAWAQTFFDEGVELVVECDSHLVKRTWPIRPHTGGGNDEGFVRDDNFGTVYSGEGTWGAPLRTYDDAKSWTRDGGAFNQLQWVHVTDQEMRLHSIRTANASSVAEVSDLDPFSWPANLDVWTPSNGAVAVIPARAGGPTCDVCGDGNVTGAEVCDPGIPADTATCDYDGGTGSQACTPVACGDGYINAAAGEECETGVDTSSCDYAGGTGAQACTFATCGDSYFNAAAEQCETSADSASCDFDGGTGPEACTAALCGDSYHNTVAEACDDGNPDNGDDCIDTCALAACGDGFTHISGTAPFEACDPGASDSAACDFDGGTGAEACTVASCGDGYTNAAANERCDDGAADSAGCDFAGGTGPEACTPALCGDAYLNVAASEACDDGAADSATCDFAGGAGPQACTLVACGDGYLNLVVEECETTADSMTCDFDSGTGAAACTLALCQDGYLNVAANEVCDYGPDVPGDDCDAMCQTACAVVPGAVRELMARRQTLDVEFSWQQEPNASAYRVYGVVDRVDIASADAAGGATLHCSSPNGLTVTCTHVGGVAAVDPLLYYQTVALCADGVTEGGH